MEQQLHSPVGWVPLVGGPADLWEGGAIIFSNAKNSTFLKNPLTKAGGGTLAGEPGPVGPPRRYGAAFANT